MKVLDRAAFMLLPEGTLYRKGVPWAFGPMEVKADTLSSNDWVCMEIGAFEADDSGAYSEMLDVALATGGSLPMTDDFFGRDGCFDPEEVFLVLERDDLLVLQRLVEIAIRRQSAIEAGKPVE